VRHNSSALEPNSSSGTNPIATAIPAIGCSLTDAVAAVKELTDSSDIRAIVAYEEAHKNRARVVSAAQTRLADIAQEVVGIST